MRPVALLTAIATAEALWTRQNADGDVSGNRDLQIAVGNTTLPPDWQHHGLLRRAIIQSHLIGDEIGENVARLIRPLLGPRTQDCGAKHVRTCRAIGAYELAMWQGHCEHTDSLLWRMCVGLDEYASEGTIAAAMVLGYTCVVQALVDGITNDERRRYIVDLVCAHLPDGTSSRRFRLVASKTTSLVCSCVLGRLDGAAAAAVPKRAASPEAERSPKRQKVAQ